MLADFAALLERGQGLPGRHFTDEAVFELERHAVFMQGWMCIGLSSDIPAKGDIKPVNILGHSLLLVREDALQVFHNVCSHRGSPLVETPAHGRARIVCPYHSWTYRLDGELVSTPHVGGPRRHTCETINPESLRLRRVRCAEWAGYVFINMSGIAPAF
jgi:choline monooxygenase